MKVKLSLSLTDSALCQEDKCGSDGITSLFLTPALHGGEWSTSHLYRFTSGEIALRYPSDRRLGGLQNRSIDYKENTEIFPLLGVEPRPLSRQAVVCCSTDRAVNTCNTKCRPCSWLYTAWIWSVCWRFGGVWCMLESKPSPSSCLCMSAQKSYWIWPWLYRQHVTPKRR